MPGTCSECARVGTLRRGFCDLHYRRFMRHGDPSVRLTGNGKVSTKGYRYRYDSSHLLAMPSSGYVAEHRSVLFSVLGFGPHLCHWCGTHINWRYGLEPDHVNFDKLDNRPENLVPSCQRCNASRRCRSDHDMRET